MSQIEIDRRHEDLQWAIEAPEVLDKYMSEYVVPFERRIVAHGTDLELVLKEAAQRTGKETWELTFCAVLDPLQDTPH
jgi:hypothetical protein